MKHRIVTFSPEGDTTLAEWEVGDAYAEEVARQVFDRAKREGWAAVAEAPSKTEGAVTVGKFSPKLSNIVLLRPIAGG